MLKLVRIVVFFSVVALIQLGAPASPVAAPAGVPKSGQTTSFAAGDDGALQRGVAWPNPRFTTNADTSIIDNLAGLVWAPNGNLMPIRDPGWDTDYVSANSWEAANDGMVKWQHALDYVAKLNAENYLGHNDWRLPNINELESLINLEQADVSAWLNTQGFTNAQANDYWSSSTYAYDPSYAWDVWMYDGYVWPVRSGQ